MCEKKRIMANYKTEESTQTSPHTRQWLLSLWHIFRFHSLFFRLLQLNVCDNIIHDYGYLCRWVTFSLSYILHLIFHLNKNVRQPWLYNCLMKEGKCYLKKLNKSFIILYLEILFSKNDNPKNYQTCKMDFKMHNLY